jgi:hypothetical protein
MIPGDSGPNLNGRQDCGARENLVPMVIEDAIGRRQMVLDHVARAVDEVSCRQCGGACGSEWKAIAWEEHHPVLV